MTVQSHRREARSQSHPTGTLEVAPSRAVGTKRWIWFVKTRPFPLYASSGEHKRPNPQGIIMVEPRKKNTSEETETRTFRTAISKARRSFAAAIF